MERTDLPRRRALLLPVLLATVFLVIIAASLGAVLGDRAAKRAAGSPSSSSVITVAPFVPAVSTSPLPTATSTPSTAAPMPSKSPSTTASPTPAAATASGAPVELLRKRTACRAETQTMAKKAGAQGKVYTREQFTNELGAVWICADDDGRLFYHLWRNVDGEFWVEGDSALFVADPKPRGDGYEARYVGEDGSIPMTVDPVELRIVRPQGYIEVLPTLSIKRWAKD